MTRKLGAVSVAVMVVLANSPTRAQIGLPDVGHDSRVRSTQKRFIRFSGFADIGMAIVAIAGGLASKGSAKKALASREKSQDDGLGHMSNAATLDYNARLNAALAGAFYALWLEYGLSPDYTDYLLEKRIDGLKRAIKK